MHKRPIHRVANELVLTKRDAGVSRPVAPLLAASAVVAVLLPAHPSLQVVLLQSGIPSAVVSAVFGLPVLARMTAIRWTRDELVLGLAFVSLLLWLLVRAVFSPAYGAANHAASVRSIVLLMPLAIACAFLAARRPRVAAVTIFAMGGLAVCHYVAVLVLSENVWEGAGFRSLSVDGEKHNYQATSFYFGFAALGFATLAARSRGMSMIWFSIAAFGVVGLMATVGARASLIAVCICGTVVMLSGQGRLNTTVTALSMAVIGYLMFTHVYLSYGLTEKFVVAERITVLLEGGDVSHRGFLFMSALRMWLLSPSNFLFGGGIGSFPMFIGHESDGWYPHNFILESLAEAGVIAGAIIGVIALMFMARFVRLGAFSCDVELHYLAWLGVYAVFTYQFVGGVQVLWLPAFFVAIFLFSRGSKVR